MKANSLSIAITCAVALASSGCATVTSSDMQSLTLSTKTAADQPIDKAICTLKNDRGAWELLSPGTVAVRRSGKDLVVECKKEGLVQGSLIATSRFADLFVNVLFGHGIGTLVDHYTGKAYEYPDDLPVTMGQSVKVDRRKEQQPASARAEESGARRD